MNRRRLITLVLLFFFAPAGLQAQKRPLAREQRISKETIVVEGKKRTYYLYLPQSVAPASSVPLVVLLHGSNRNGLSLAEKWNTLADKEGFIIVAPDSADSASWSVPVDGPGFLHELVEALKIKYPINPKKVYLFGHSGGATFALLMSLYESEYFSATAIHAGALQADAFSLIDVAKRKTPIHIQVGTADDSYPLKVVTTTREQLNARGFAARLVVMPGHTHWYYDLAPEINERAWEFMKGFELPSEPRYEDYKFRPEGRKSTEASEQYLLGMKRQQAGDAAGAIDAYTRAIQLDAKYAEAYNNRGVAYMAQNEYVLAAVDFTRSIELAPSEAAYNNRGSIYAAQEKTGAAIADYTSAIKIKPSAEAYSNRGISYAQINRNDAALSDFDDAIKLNPKFGRAYILRGLILLKRGGQDSAAQKDFDKGFELDSSLHAEFDAIIKTRLRN